MRKNCNGPKPMDGVTQIPNRTGEADSDPVVVSAKIGIIRNIRVRHAGRKQAAKMPQSSGTRVS